MVCIKVIFISVLNSGRIVVPQIAQNKMTMLILDFSFFIPNINKTVHTSKIPNMYKQILLYLKQKQRLESFYEFMTTNCCFSSKWLMSVLST